MAAWPPAASIGLALDQDELAAGGAEAGCAGEAHEAHRQVAEEQEVDASAR